MDKKAHKKVAVLRQRIQKLQRALAGAKSQTDEPQELERIEKELQQTKFEIEMIIGI